MHRTTTMFAAVAVVLATAAKPAEAQPWKGIARVVTAPARATVSVVTAPARAVVQVAEGESVVSTARELAATPVNAAATAATAHADANAAVGDGIRDVAREIGGRPAAGVVGLATSASNGMSTASSSLLQSSGAIIEGTAAPADVIGIPLAALIEHAEREHAGRAQPIPEDVKAALRGLISDAVLEAARYTIGELEISLPNAVSGTRKLFVGDEGGHAVVVGHVIVFSRAPADSYSWWAHELTHVEQYRRWGTVGFARRYTTDSGTVEAAAEAVAEQYIARGSGAR
jgi:hypothetical protein